MCRACWALVPEAIAAEVYRTVRLRGPRVDSSWSAWWRAAHRAIAENAVVREIFTEEQAKAYVEKEDAVAARFEKRDQP